MKALEVLSGYVETAAKPKAKAKAKISPDKARAAIIALFKQGGSYTYWDVSAKLKLDGKLCYTIVEALSKERLLNMSSGYTSHEDPTYVWNQKAKSVPAKAPTTPTAAPVKIPKRGGPAGAKSLGKDGMDDKIVKAIGVKMTARLSRRFIDEDAVRYYLHSAGKVCITAVENTNVVNAWFSVSESLKELGLDMAEFTARLERMGIKQIKKPKAFKSRPSYYD